MNQPKISVIMPVYNMAEYLEEVLSCWTNQTMKEIEIICVDDASTDDSLAVLQRWAEKDSRLIVHHFSENKSAWVARKWGIEHCGAEYILFADADDTMDLRACEELYAEMKKKPVDILHFDANIINVNGLPEQRIRNMERFVAPYAGTLEGERIFTGCFREKLYQFSLWNKLFSAELCKRAVAGTKDLFLPKAQDKLLYWTIALRARTYRGLPGKCYYNYFLGRGGTGYNRLTLKQFERYCTMADTANAMHDFLKETGLLADYEQEDKDSRAALLNDCFARFRNEISEENKAAAFDLMLRKWNTEEVLAALAKAEWFNRYAVAKYLRGCESLKYDKSKQPKTIATYYHSCANGGAQRVMCDVSNILASMGYEVILFTDEEPSENDYATPVNAKRIVLPHYKKVNKDNYVERIRVLEAAIKEYHVDVMLYHAWVLNFMMWDELVCKANGVAFIGHCHNIFSLPMLNAFGNAYNYAAPYMLADAVVTLSKVDRYYWKHFNSNVHVTLNPFAESFEAWETSDKLDEKQILWVGRLSSEKRPKDVLKIMKAVVEQEPEAHLHIVGSNPSQAYMDDFQKEINANGLASNITMHGFHLDVRSFYQNASIFLMTSEYEGFSLTLQESKMAGLPCVMYDLPYLTLCEGNRGIVPVEPNNTKAAADAIVDLLQDDEKRHRYAKEARAHIEELSRFDFTGKWASILASLGQDHEDEVPEEGLIMMDTILNHHSICVDRKDRKIKSMTSITGVSSITLPKLIHKIKRGLKCCADHGVAYTMKRAVKKLVNWIRKK